MTIINYLTTDNMRNLNSMSQDIKDIKDQFSDLRVLIAGLPQQILDKADERYACKAVEKEVENLKTTRDNRNFDWLKFSAMIFISIILSLVLNKYTNIGI